MIGKLSGIYGGKAGEGAALVEVAGVGYAVRMPLGVLLTLRSGQELSLFIHTAVRDDAIDLYGFPTDEELSFFRQLTSVSGIGPKSALGILNVSDVATLKRSIGLGDASTLTKVFGIGKKSAERIVVELRDKLASAASERSPDGTVGASSDIEVLEALMALGYSAGESRAALKLVSTRALPADATVREKLAVALRGLGTPA